jgi:hypothetical protein
VFSNLLNKALITFFCLLFVSILQGECVTVEPKPQESSPHTRVAVSLRGKPAKGVTVDFYLQGTQQAVFKGMSDENGIVVTPKLTKKDYNVVATLDKYVQTSEWLRVVSKHEANTISLDLTGAYYQAYPELSLETYKGAEEPVHDRIQTFEGSLTDPSGAAVSDTKIRVLKMGVPYQGFMLAIKPNEDGHFTAQLPEGRYIVYFFANGFKTERTTFEIAKDGSKALNITLRVGSC